MSPVARLVWTYFSATPLNRALAVLGFVCVAAGISTFLLVPGARLNPGVAMTGQFLQAIVLALPWLGFVCLLGASALLPRIVEGLVTGRRIWILPQGRARLLISALVPGIVLAMLTAASATAAFVSFSSADEAQSIFLRTSLMAFVDVGLIYTAMWLVGKTTGAWRLAGLLWTVACVLIPLRYFGGIPPFSVLEALGLASWVAFGAFVLAGGRQRHTLAGLRERFAALTARSRRDDGYRAGREADLLLDIDDPWVVALGQIVPILAVAWLVPDMHAWIVFLVVFSALSGANSSRAALRSRRFWLHYPLTRTEVAGCVERAYWHYSVKSLVVLVLAYLSLAAWFGFPPAVQLLGCLLLVLGTAVSLWLGLTITTGLGWLEAVLCIVTMVLLALASVALMVSNLQATAGLLVVLAALGGSFRGIAAARWKRLDWLRAR